MRNQIREAIDHAVADVGQYQDSAMAAHDALQRGQGHLQHAAAAIGAVIESLRLAASSFKESQGATTAAAEAAGSIAAGLYGIEAEASGQPAVQQMLTDLQITTERLNGAATGAGTFVEGADHYVGALVELETDIREKFTGTVANNAEALAPHTGQNPAHFKGVLEGWQSVT